MSNGRNVLKRVINKLLHAPLQVRYFDAELDEVSIELVVVIIEQIMIPGTKLLLDLHELIDQRLHPFQLIL